MILTIDVDKLKKWCQKQLVGESFEIFRAINIPETKAPSRFISELTKRCKKECAAGPFLPCFFACFKDTMYRDTVYKGFANCKNCAENVAACGFEKCAACQAELENFHPEPCFGCMHGECNEALKCGMYYCVLWNC